MSAPYNERDLECWAVADVVDFLRSLELEPVVASFKENAICGSMLTSLTDEELTNELGMRPLQIKKLKGALDKVKAAQLADDAAGTRDVGAAHAAALLAPAATAADGATQPAALSVPASVSDPVAGAAQVPVVAAAAVVVTAAAPAMAAHGAGAQIQPTVAGAMAVTAVEPAQQAPTAASMRAYNQAQLLLRQADGALAQASDLTGRALGTQAVQTGVVASEPRRRGLNPFGMLVDVRQKQQTRMACELADTAVNAINQARTLAPDIPPIRMPVVKEMTGALVQGLTRSPLMDAYRTGKVAISKQSIDACRQQIVAAQAFLAGRISGMAAAAQAQPQPQALPQPTSQYQQQYHHHHQQQQQQQAQFQQQAFAPAPSAQYYAPPVVAQAGIPMAAPPPPGYAAAQASPMAGSSAGSIAGTALVGGMLMGAAARNARVRRGARLRR